MKVKIQKMSDAEYMVNEYRVYRDIEGNWVGQMGMTTNEVAAFQKHLSKKDKQLITKE